MLMSTETTTEKKLQEMREKEAKFSQRFVKHNPPTTQAEIDYLKNMEATNPVRNPKNLEELLKNLQTLRYGNKPKRVQLIPFDDAKQLFYVCAMHLTNGEFTFNEYNTEIIENMIKWFIADPTGKYDLKKGLCLIGFIGTGKTKLFEIFRYMMDSFYKEEVKFKIKVCTEIAKQTSKAEDLMKNYGGMVMFDDIGTEENDVKIFGNTVGVMSDIIFQRELSHELNGLITHFTSNLLPKKLEAKYGDRIYDRIQKMSTIIVTKQQFSWRKKV